MPRTKKIKAIDGPIKISDDSFVVKHIESDESEEIVTYPVIRESKAVAQEPEAVEKVKVSFDNFVKLVANHNYEDVIDKNKDEHVIVSSNLLADLANAHEQEEERRIPAIFIIGVLVGIVITYILLTY